jgi:hypothetical protein
MGDLRQPETVQVVVLCVLVGVAVGLFVTGSVDGLLWVIVGLAAVWLVYWLWVRLVPRQLDRLWPGRGWRD